MSHLSLSHSRDNPTPPLRRREFLARLMGVSWAAPWFSRAARAAEKADADSYARYVRTSKDFRRVKQEKAWLLKAFPGWLYMPWTYQWRIGYTEASGKWCQRQGFNGAFLDGNGGAPDSPPGKLAWINRFRLRFYVDHATGKGNLHLWDGGAQKPHLAEMHGPGLRPVPLNDALQQKLRGILHGNISQVKSSPFRAAYALDDEVSWGHFVHPTMWRITDDDAAYPAWLKEVYGPENAPAPRPWMTYEDIRPNLDNWSVRDFDVSPLLNQWSFNDSLWGNFLGDLVEYANSVDPETPCGIVGGQAPNAFGGYDYAKLMRKIQYIEGYNTGSSQAIIRSFNPRNAVPAVTSHFHQSPEDDIWQLWYYLAHGNRGHIGWVENWFEGETPRPWLDAVAPHYREAAQKIGPLMQGAEWMHDGVALYYSHSAIQMGWILDAMAHGKTWVNRDSDHRLGASHQVRQAWENMLRDSGLQYNHVSYAEVIQSGVPTEYKALILPACLCLSDAEAKAIEAFCRRGGLVIADYLPGVWDQHGRGRTGGGALDALFGVRHNPAMTVRDVFGGTLWSETDQDKNFGWKSYDQLLTNGPANIRHESGFNKAVREMAVGDIRRVGGGKSLLLNLSPQWYNAYRVAGDEAARRREIFMRPLHDNGIARWVSLENAGTAEFGYEITCFRKPDGRKILFLCWNPEIIASETGGGGAARLKSDASEIILRFARPVRAVRDERRQMALGDGDKFKFVWRKNEAIVLSFA